ncbi:hypothetical protein KIY74_gp42 [Mycobacterium phage ICleared]|uniref:Uncharacterized protein n=3 Tax=Backyardiganvirus TaxID=2946815 RepID=A0A1C9LYN9_9CAUD|nr:hypothetical protein FGG45_gp41 [Mycobacterium phage Arturo]YP_010062945.1 hypothetical protein KIY74_gp42 [Mycobacterium phage ICleared]YP_010063208.1 hypothetical protein KIY77_gp40 [Mycobacterium phage Mundrea]APM00075.1 hypothetical protein SEA_KRATARK_41 [Mycobacterium phage Kratark]AFL46648.1 hypothetical protein ICLEARED_42 [Mycobacterium phage ICleared]AFU20493.1 hypothetical protein ARTURO_40 [Mycobacterium phage Arturo]AOQ27968.1 hypothetical protein SEA_MUNDREA_40 [Mycobacterium
MKWMHGGEGDSPAIAPLRPPSTTVELYITLPDQSSIPEFGENHRLTVQQLALGVENMSQVERNWAIRTLIESVVEAAITELEEKGILRGGS